MARCQAQSWSQARGPLSAVRLTLERVGWQVVNAAAWRAHEDVDVHVFELAPWIVRRLLLRAVQAWQWREVSKGTGLEHLANGGVFEPLSKMTTTGAVSRNGVCGDTTASHGGQGPGPCVASCRVGAHDAREDAEGLHRVPAPGRLCARRSWSQSALAAPVRVLRGRPADA
eukprot:4402029-Pyramimonas_sp.AAC.1